MLYDLQELTEGNGQNYLQINALNGSYGQPKWTKYQILPSIFVLEILVL